jgi:hypothetical protein
MLDHRHAAAEARKPMRKMSAASWRIARFGDPRIRIRR